MFQLNPLRQGAGVQTSSLRTRSQQQSPRVSHLLRQQVKSLLASFFPALFLCVLLSGTLSLWMRVRRIHGVRLSLLPW